MIVKGYKYNRYLFLGLTALFYSLTLIFNRAASPPPLDVSLQEKAINFDDSFLKFFSLGNKRLFSSVLWIQTLLQSDEAHYKGKNYGNWMYLRFLTISSLDPLFYENYLWGGMYLSIVKDDVLAAARIFELGLDKYPEDYKLNYHAGFNYYAEMGEYEKALPLLKKIVNHPKAPPILPFIVNKLEFETSGDYEATLAFLSLTLASVQGDDVLRNKLERDIYALKADRDLECLNKGSADCSHIDAAGNAYIFKDGKWMAQILYKPFKIYRRTSDKK